MKHLYYQGKFYKSISDELAQQLSLALVSPKRPYQVQVDDELLKSSMIEIRTNTEATPRKFSYDYQNQAHKQVIRQFARDLQAWFAMQPPERQAFEYYLEEKGAIAINGSPRIGASSGLPIFGPNQILVRNPALLAELSEKWSTYQDFMRFASKPRPEDAEAARSLAADADQMFPPVP
jgi:hypothetical protein